MYVDEFMIIISNEVFSNTQHENILAHTPFSTIYREPPLCVCRRPCAFRCLRSRRRWAMLRVISQVAVSLSLTHKIVLSYPREGVPLEC